LAEFKNPTQSGGGQDNKSLLVTALVMVAVFSGLQFYRSKHNPQTASPNQSVLSQGQAGQGASSAPPVPNAAVAAVNHAAAGTSATPAILAAAESTTTVENELYRIEFTNRGAQVLSWKLKKQKDSYGQPLDLVHEQAAKQYGFPLSLYTYDSATTTALAQALYVPSATGTLPSPASLTFQYTDNGLAVTKTGKTGDRKRPRP